MTPETRIELAGVGPVACIAMAWRDGATARGGKSDLRITLMVKATFALVPDGAATLRGGAPIIPADRHYEGSARRSVETPGDLAPRKARADFVVTGHAYAPGGAAAPASSARLGLFRDGVVLDKTLHVYGDRTRALTTPQPFARVPLLYERGYGGPSSAENPVGVGLDGTPALPNIIDPKEPTRRAGFGPIASAWPPRTSMLTAEDVRALAAPIPEIRADFPWAYFQCAPPDQQAELLRGDEGILLDGLHPTMPRIHTRLPGVRGRARVHRRQGTSWDAGFPLSLACDTCAVDADHMLARLTFRGDFEAGVEIDRLGDVRVVAGIEIGGVPVGRSVDPSETAAAAQGPVSVRGPASARLPVMDSGPPSSRVVESKRTMDGSALGALAGGMPATPFKRLAPGAVSIASLPDEKPKPRAPDKGSTLPVESDLGERLAKALATPFDHTPIAPAEPSRAAAPPAEDGPRQASTAFLSPAQAEALERALATPWGAPTRADTAAPRGNTAGLPFAQGNAAPPVLAAPPPVMAPAAMTVPAMAPPAMAPAVIAPPIMAPAVVAPPVMPSPVMAPAVMAPAIMGPPPPSHRPESVAAPVVETGLRGDVLSRMKSGAGLAGLALAKADLSDLDLSGANLVGVDLRGSRFDRAKLTGADLTGANLTGARGEGAWLERAKCDRASFARGRWEGAIFDEASMTEADLSGATLTRASLCRVDLSDAKLGDVSASQATLDGAKLARAHAEGASLTGASLVDVDAAEIALDRATLSDARASGAKLDRASLAGAICERATFAGASLEGARLGRATLTGADLTGADLTGADLRQARATGARFEAARLIGVQGSRADFSEARLGAADLTDAVLRPSRLMRADLSRAKLDRADLRDADLTGATLTGASREGTKTNGAKMGGVID